nr:hypothetical protein [Treponema sp.]
MPVKKKFWQKKDNFPLYKSPARAKIRKAGRFIIAALICAFFSAPIFAETYYWAGGGADANWTTAANWSPSTGYPSNNTDEAFIAADAPQSYTIDINENITVGTVHVAGKVTINVNNNFKATTLN